MKTIVVVCAPTRDAALSSEKAAVRPNLDCFQLSVSPGIRVINGTVESPKFDQSTLPFWTWFIENPRGRLDSESN